MQKEQKKAIFVNILTVLVVGGLLFAGYVVFVKPITTEPDGIATPTVSVAEVAEKTATIGSQVNSTIRDLRDLERAVASSTVIFKKPSFKNLEDFTATVPSEPVGRDDPFVPPLWKTKILTFETSGVKTSASATIPAPAKSQSAQAKPQLPASTNLLGNFGAGI